MENSWKYCLILLVQKLIWNSNFTAVTYRYRVCEYSWRFIWEIFIYTPVLLNHFSKKFSTLKKKELNKLIVIWIFGLKAKNYWWWLNLLFHLRFHIFKIFTGDLKFSLHGKMTRSIWKRTCSIFFFSRYPSIAGCKSFSTFFFHPVFPTI